MGHTPSYAGIMYSKELEIGLEVYSIFQNCIIQKVLHKKDNTTSNNLLICVKRGSTIIQACECHGVSGERGVPINYRRRRTRSTEEQILLI